MGSFQWEIDFMTALQGASGKVLTPIIEGVSMPLAAFLRREYCSEERAAGRTGVPLREVFVCVDYCHGFYPMASKDTDKIWERERSH